MLKRLIQAAVRTNTCACNPPKKRKDHKKKDAKEKKPIVQRQQKTSTKLQDGKPEKVKQLRFLDNTSRNDPFQDKPRHRPRSLTIWPRPEKQFVYPWDIDEEKNKKEKLAQYYYKHVPERENHDEDMSFDEYNRIFHKEARPMTTDYMKKTRLGKSRLATWYQKRKTYNELKVFYAKEQKREKKERKEREKARRIKEEELLSRLRGPTTMDKKHKNKIVVGRTEHKVIVKKKRTRNEDCEHKFVNCCYRLCCQFYCCLTCLVIISFFIIFVL